MIGEMPTPTFNYPDHAFDFVILAQTLQQREPPRRSSKTLTYWPPGNCFPAFRLLTGQAVARVTGPYAAYGRVAAQLV